jgi:hypothetical protein
MMVVLQRQFRSKGDARPYLYASTNYYQGLS